MVDLAVNRVTLYFIQCTPKLFNTGKDVSAFCNCKHNIEITASISPKSVNSYSIKIIKTQSDVETSVYRLHFFLNNPSYSDNKILSTVPNRENLSSLLF